MAQIQKEGVDPFSADEIRKAIIENRKLSRAEEILGEPDLETPLSRMTGSLPSILQARFEQDMETASSYVKNFEHLSLAVRAKVFRLAPAGAERPPWLASGPLEKCRAEDVLEGVLAAVKEITDPKTAHARPASLKLVGLHIVGDLNLSKLDIPFSIRMMACYVEGALLLDRSSLVTLDTSGSIFLNGLSANYARLSGAMRARRMVSLGPVDFGGARVGGSVDLTDSVIYPENPPTCKAAYVADRGIFNFSLAELQKDVRISRARIYGGVNLRGCRVGGLLHMNDAVLRCPIAHFEIMLHAASQKVSHECGDATWKTKHASIATIASMDAGTDIAALLHPKSAPDYESARKTEVLGDDLVLDRIWSAGRPPEPFRLMKEARPIAESAIRGEGLRVDGPIYAYGMRVCGRVRLKSLKTGGGVSFNGSRFRTVRSLRQDIEARCIKSEADKSRHNGVSSNTSAVLTRLLETQKNREMGLSANARAFRKEYAIDLRDAEISGPLDFGHDPRRDRVKVRTDGDLLNVIASELCTVGANPTDYITIFTSTKENSGFDEKSNDEDVRRRLKLVSRGKGANGNRRSQSAYDPDLQNFQDREELAKRMYDIAAVKAAPEKLDSKYKNTHRDLQIHAIRAKRDLALIRSEYPLLANGVTRDLKAVTKDVCTVASESGTLNATLLIGEIRLINAHIRGGVIFSSMIANIFGATDPSASGDDTNQDEDDEEDGMSSRRVVNMRNAIIEGDVDFSNSIGISSINAKQVHIHGSIKFCERPRFSSKSQRYHPLRKKAFFPVPDKQRNKNRPLNTFHFERSRIDRNAVFLFDREHGPNLYLASSEIGENLHILPAKRELQMPKREIQETFADDTDRRRTPWMGRVPLLRSFLIAVFLRRFFYIELIEQVLNNLESDAKRPARIDLRGARAIEVSHPPTAWPKRNGLLVTGFRYERSNVLGPLAPAWWSWPKAFATFHQHLEAGWLHRVLWLIFLIGMSVTGFVWWHLVQGSEWLSAARAQWGGMNMIFGLLFITCLIMYCIMLFTRGDKSRVGAKLATYWLGLQRRHFNTNRVLMDSLPYEPYLRASNVLRSAGYSDAADEVELARLRQRTKDMSWRVSAAPKVFLWALDRFISYGFRPVRAAGVVCGFLLIASLVFQQAQASGKIACRVKPIVARVVDPEDANAVKTVLPPACHFNSMWYTLNMFVPMSPIESSTEWVLVEPDDAQPVAWIFHTVLTIRLLGWLLITLVAFAVAARIETLFARSRLKD